jgi:hypothetical protein
MTATDTTVLARELAGWRKRAAGELRSEAAAFEARAEAARKAADVLDPPRRTKRKQTTTGDQA